MIDNKCRLAFAVSIFCIYTFVHNFNGVKCQTVTRPSEKLWLLIAFCFQKPCLRHSDINNWFSKNRTQARELPMDWRQHLKWCLGKICETRLLKGKTSLDPHKTPHPLCFWAMGAGLGLSCKRPELHGGFSVWADFGQPAEDRNTLVRTVSNCDMHWYSRRNWTDLHMKKVCMPWTYCPLQRATQLSQTDNMFLSYCLACYLES